MSTQFPCIKPHQQEGEASVSSVTASSLLYLQCTKERITEMNRTQETDPMVPLFIQNLSHSLQGLNS